MYPRNVLVTGGAGYIGAHTVFELFSAGFNPIILDNFSRCDRTLVKGLEKLLGRPPIVLEGDCGDPDFLYRVFSTYEFSGAMHFAAYKAVGESVEKPILYYQNNLNSLIALIEAMQKFGVNDLVFSSSCTVYGQPDTVPVSETAPMKKAESPYGATKQMCERILEDAQVLGLRIASLRYFNPIGAHPSALLGELPIGVPGNLVPYITQTAIGKRPMLTIFGSDYNTPDGTNIRDFIHVVDLAQAHVAALDFLQARPSTGHYEVFNLGSGRGCSVLELVQSFEQVTGLKLNYQMGTRRPGDVEKTYADPGKANRMLNWKAGKSIDDALRDAWRWEQALAEKL